MITILTSFKPFVGDDAVRQLRAIESWKLSFPNCEILAFGESGDIESLVRKYGINHITNIPLGDKRLPRIDSMFSKAQSIGRFDFQLYTNADMILGSDFEKVLPLMPSSSYLCIGQRWDLDELFTNSFSTVSDVIQVQNIAQKDGELHSSDGLDYFGYMRGVLCDLKPLYVGAAGWDNYMVARALKLRMKIVDITPSVIAVHQQHNYTYTNGGKNEVYHGIIAKQNRAFLEEANQSGFGCCADATHEISNNKLKRASSYKYVERRLSRLHEKQVWLRKSPLPWKWRWYYSRIFLYAGV